MGKNQLRVQLNQNEKNIQSSGDNNRKNFQVVFRNLYPSTVTEEITELDYYDQKIIRATCLSKDI